MTLSELIEQLQWFEDLFSGDLEVKVAMTSIGGPGVKKKDIIDIFCGTKTGEAVDKLTIFGGN